jgi:hypothetical protein
MMQRPIVPKIGGFPKPTTFQRLKLSMRVRDHNLWPGSGEWLEIVCPDNRHEYYNNKDSDVPTAHKPDF